MLRPWLILVTFSFVLLRCLVSPSRIVVPAGARGVLLLPGIVTDYQRICDILLVGYYWCHLLLFVIGMDKSKITRKQSKASKHGHENQKSTKPKPQKTKALANFHLQGPFLQFPKVIYNLKERKERRGPNVQPFQTTTVLTVKKGAGTPFTIHRLSHFHCHGKTRGKSKLEGA
ncbi:hypothetical protein Tco_0191060 [Tanacetum coccineum]